MVALFPPLDSLAGGLKLSFTLTPIQVTVPTAAPEKLGPFVAAADPTPTIVTKETGTITAHAHNKILLPMLMMSLLCWIDPLRQTWCIASFAASSNECGVLLGR